MDSLTMTEPTHGLVRIHGTVEQVAEMLTNAGYPKDAERLLAAQAKRERKGRLRRYRLACDALRSHTGDPSTAVIPEYELMPEWRVSVGDMSNARLQCPR